MPENLTYCFRWEILRKNSDLKQVTLFKLKEKHGYGFDTFHFRYWSKINQLPTFSKSKGMGKKLPKIE